ncbi:Fic/DOC family protein [Nocardioides sp.]|uniref:Fic/DOC family protein n=1 Tax=Nocardioides sp. TaxID=35761 RepID=UPI0035144A57
MGCPDPYLTQDGVLRNLVGAATRAELAEAEADLVSARTLTWRGWPTKDARLFGTEHLQGLHGHLFGDVYEWAGTFRTTEISKSGTDFFWPCDTLLTRAKKVLGALQRGPLLRSGLEQSVYLDALAALYRDVNYLHPFREGNGRTQRLFLSEVAAYTSRHIDWKAISRLENDEACATSVTTHSARPLRALLVRAVGCEEERSQHLDLMASQLGA